MDARLHPWLGLAVQRLCQHLSPERIILFGSQARGTATRHSDVDLFIVWDSSLAPLERIGKVLTLLADAPLPVEPIIYTSDELERCQDRPFILRLLAEGWVLYERPKP